MPVYSVHGLRVESCIELPGLPPGSPPVDVVIRRATVCAPDPGASDTARWFHATPFITGIVQKNAGAIVVRHGQEVLFDQAPDADANKVAQLLGGPAMVALLQQRGALPMHASSVRMNGCAVVFPGHSGSGKSALAAALYARGHDLLSDDIVPLWTNGNGVHTYPGPLTIRLQQDGADLLKRAGMLRDQNLKPSDDKLVLQTNHACPDEPIRIKAFYAQEEGSCEAIEPLSPQEALILSLRYTYANDLYSVTEGQKSHLAKSSSIARGALFFRLVRRRESVQIGALLEMLEDHYHQL